ncbi:hypothetical protein BC834DRAFT_846941 [Gloeopeniophorella convolvens]|nr:hypothetical protein BC834DRAFT_846941 [Gloeopeniophorella convolvens]
MSVPLSVHWYIEHGEGGSRYCTKNNIYAGAWLKYKQYDMQSYWNRLSADGYPINAATTPSSYSVSPTVTEQLATRWDPVEQLQREGIPVRTGPFTKEEDALLRDALKRSKEEHDLTKEGLDRRIFGGVRDQRIWGSLGFLNLWKHGFGPTTLTFHQLLWVRTSWTTSWRPAPDPGQRHPASSFILAAMGTAVLLIALPVLVLYNTRPALVPGGRANPGGVRSCARRRFTLVQIVFDTFLCRYVDWSDVVPNGGKDWLTSTPMVGEDWQGPPARVHRLPRALAFAREEFQRGADQSFGSKRTEAGQLLERGIHSHGANSQAQAVSQQMALSVWNHRVAALRLDTGAVPWAPLSEGIWAWNAHKLHQKWSVLKQRAASEGASHREILPDLCSGGDVGPGEDEEAEVLSGGDGAQAGEWEYSKGDDPDAEGERRGWRRVGAGRADEELEYVDWDEVVLAEAGLTGW